MNPNNDAQVYVGIDLGTTYSSISYFDPHSNDVLVVNATGTSTINASHTTLSKNKKDKKTFNICGNEAKNKGGSFMLYDSKRLIGKTIKEYEEMGNEKDNWSFEVKEDENGFCQMVIPNPLDENELEFFYPEEVTSFILSYLMKLLKEKIGNTQIKTIVVTIPVKFTPAQRFATERACRLSGVENIVLINEPSASIVDYKRFLEKNNYPPLEEGKRILVIDFGGGTLDICCCKIVPKDDENSNETKIEVIQCGGNQDLGGKHLDLLLLEVLKTKLEENGFDDLKILLTYKGNDLPKKKKLKRNTIFKALVECEKIKMDLSRNQNCELDLDKIFGSDYMDETITITREDFETEIEKTIIPQFVECIQQVMESCQWKTDDVDLVLPIGGSCLVPIIRRTIDEMFKDKSKRALELFDPLNAVVRGAAYHALSLSFVDPTLQDVLPYSILTDLTGGRTSVLLKKGTKLPCEVKKIYLLNRDYQDEVSFNLYVGEGQFINSPDVKSIREAVIPIPEEKRRRKCDFKMKTILEINESGLLKMKVYKESNGEEIDSLETRLEINKLEDFFDEMLEHMNKFKN